MKKHIGWVKYCTTPSSISSPTDKKCTPWPCGTCLGLAKPKLLYLESSEQFFWVKIYIKV